ncbi:MAG: hypothetical protein RI907_2996 [Pseudomonadota bacterium]|jgi:NRPS condensation-like uncharacterized protein
MASIITGDKIPLNRTEHAYVAVDGFAGTMMVVTVMRISQPITIEMVRKAARDLLTAYPRLRSLVEPGPWRYFQRILPDGPLMDQIALANCYEDKHVDVDDPLQFETWQRLALNDPMPLEHGPAFKFRLVPHATSPGLLIGIHHLVADGMTHAFLVHNILRSLNGMPMEQIPVEAPSMIEAIQPAKWWQWPAQVMKSRAHKVAEAKRLKEVNIVQLPTRESPHYTTTGVRHHEVTMGSSEMRKAAKKAGVSVNTLMVAAHAHALLATQAHDPKAAAVIRISVDLRRFYPKEAKHGMLMGNHVGAYIIIEQGANKDAVQRLKDVDASLKEGLARYTNREMSWTYLLDELSPWVGRVLIGYLAWKLKRANKFPKISVHVTTGGNVTILNVPGQPIHLTKLFVMVPSISPLSGTVESNGKYFMPMAWQMAETSYEEIGAFQQQVENALTQIVTDVLAADLPEPVKA